MDKIIEVAVIGAMFGCLYALIGAGLNLVWGVCNVLNVMHGQFLVFGAYITWLLWSGHGVHPLLTIPIGAAVMFILGALMQFALVERMTKYPMMIAFIMLFGLSLMADNLTVQAAGENAHSVPFYQSSFQAGFLTIPYADVVIVIVSFVVLVAAQLYLSRSKFGVATAATAQNAEIAQACGINVRRIRIMTMGIASAMASIAGSCLVLTFPITPEAGIQYTTIAFTVVVLGGLGSFYGSIIAGILMGIVVGIVGLYVGGLALGASFALLVIVLLVKPSGLAGLAHGVRP